jgi:hypothetical protein
LDTPPPTYFSSRVELMGENITGKEKEDIQQLFNTTSTVIQQPENVDLTKNAYNQDSEGYRASRIYSTLN